LEFELKLGLRLGLTHCALRCSNYSIAGATAEAEIVSLYMNADKKMDLHRAEQCQFEYTLRLAWHTRLRQRFGMYGVQMYLLKCRCSSAQLVTAAETKIPTNKDKAQLRQSARSSAEPARDLIDVGLTVH